MCELVTPSHSEIKHKEDIIKSPNSETDSCRRRSGCPASCRTINAATHTREVSSAGGEAASSKGEARKGRPGRPHPGAEAGAGPEAADPTAGAACEVEQESAKHEKK